MPVRSHHEKPLEFLLLNASAIPPHPSLRHEHISNMFQQVKLDDAGTRRPQDGLTRYGGPIFQKKDGAPGRYLTN